MLDPLANGRFDMGSLSSNAGDTTRHRLDGSHLDAAGQALLRRFEVDLLADGQDRMRHICKQPRQMAVPFSLEALSVRSRPRRHREDGGQLTMDPSEPVC